MFVHRQKGVLSVSYMRRYPLKLSISYLKKSILSLKLIIESYRTYFMLLQDKAIRINFLFKF
jgi:hypothetical protein